MSYDTVEQSVSQGRPYFLYFFDNGVTVARLTSEPRVMNEMSETWDPSSISHSDLEQNGNIEKASVDLEMPISNEFARTFLIPIAARITTVTIWRGHHTADDLKVVWKGRVVGTKSAEQKILIVLESVFTSLRRPGCRVRYQRSCRHALYFGGCRLLKADFELPATVTNVDGLVLTVTLPASSVSGFEKDFLGGIVDFNGIYGFVQADNGTSLTLVTPIEGLADEVTSAGFADVTIAPGCRLTHAYCKERFANTDNFGGFPYMSNKNPFEISIT